jgi:hypothetical protein
MRCDINYFDVANKNASGYEPISEFVKNYTCTQKVVQSCLYKQIYSSVIKRMAFTFKPEDSRNQDLNIYGMKDCFVLRYRSTSAENQSYCRVSKGHCLAYPSDYAEHRNVSDPSKETWGPRMSIRDADMSVLNKVDSSEMDKLGRCSRCVFTSSSAWYFLKDFCKNAVLTQHYYSPSKKRKIKHGITGYYFKSKISYQLLRFDNNPKCSILQDFLWHMVLVG